MKKIALFIFIGITFSYVIKAQTNSSLLVGDFNKVGDFVALHPQKAFELDLARDYPKFSKIKLGQKELVLTYKVTGEKTGAIRYFDPKRNEWIDIIPVECCINSIKGSTWLFDGKVFKQKPDVLFLYTELYSDSARTVVQAKHLTIIKFEADASFRKYEMSLNAKNKFPHKVILSKWILREQTGDFEDKYKEYSIDSKMVTSF